MLVAVDAPSHVESVGLPRDWHVSNRPVAGCATNSLVNVNAMIEINKVWQRIDAGPFNGIIGEIAIPHRLEHGAVHPDFGMATHAGVGWRNARERRIFHRNVAVPAVDAQSADVMFVAEGNGLRVMHPHVGVVRRKIDPPA